MRLDTLRHVLCALLLLASSAVAAFQIAPLGTRHEERLTNEPDATLARMLPRGWLHAPLPESPDA